MMELVVEKLDGEVVRIDALEGLSVMEVIRGAAIDDIAAACGGACSCATCHVYVDGAFAGLLSEVSEDERELLATSGQCLPTSRLACQLMMSQALDGLRVKIASDD